MMVRKLGAITLLFAVAGVASVTALALIGWGVSNGFTLGGEVMEVDLLGAYGEQMSSQPGYIEHDGKFTPKPCP